jgi:hypothetical protein
MTYAAGLVLVPLALYAATATAFEEALRRPDQTEGRYVALTILAFVAPRSPPGQPTSTCGAVSLMRPSSQCTVRPMSC